MNTIQKSPGPAAAYAFRLGTVAGGVLGLAVVGLLYWYNVLSLAATGYVMLGLFPVYLLIVAAVLSIWLGYDKDATALRPVTQKKDAERESRSDHSNEPPR